MPIEELVQPRPVVIVDETGLAEVYADVPSAEGALEPIDVDAGVYAAYRPDGTVLALSTVHGEVRITHATRLLNDPDALRTALTKQADWLSTRGLQLSRSPDELSNTELVDLLLEYRRGRNPLRRLRSWLRGRLFGSR